MSESLPENEYTTDLELDPSHEVNLNSAAAMAEELAAADQAQNLDIDPDFDPMAAIDGMTPEAQKAALNQVKDVLITDEGALATGRDGLDMIESLLQDHGHAGFTLTDAKKEQGAKRLKPIIQKYAPAALDMLGSYKDEIMAAVFFGSLTYSSVKQIKQLRALDEKQVKSEQAHEQTQTDTEEPNEVVAETDAAN